MTTLRFRIHASLLCGLMASVLASTACTTPKTANSSMSQDVVAPAAPPKGAYVDQDIPEELKNADQFDPATTLDRSIVEQSDFYQIKKSVEDNKKALDAAWKEQERIEASINAQKAEEQRQKALAAKAEEEERERQRQIAIKEFEKNKQKRAKEELEAIEEVKKLPTISRDEVKWQGLED